MARAKYSSANARSRMRRLAALWTGSASEEPASPAPRISERPRASPAPSEATTPAATIRPTRPSSGCRHEGRSPAGSLLPIAPWLEQTPCPSGVSKKEVSLGNGSCRAQEAVGTLLAHGPGPAVDTPRAGDGARHAHGVRQQRGARAGSWSGRRLLRCAGWDQWRMWRSPDRLRTYRTLRYNRLARAM